MSTKEYNEELRKELIDRDLESISYEQTTSKLKEYVQPRTVIKPSNPPENTLGWDPEVA